MNKQLYTELQECEKAMHNRSISPTKRCRASLARIRHDQILAMLPGATRRGLARGNIQFATDAQVEQASQEVIKVHGEVLRRLS